MSAQPPAEVSPELREMLLAQFTTQLYKLRSHEEVATLLSLAPGQTRRRANRLVRILRWDWLNSS